MLTEQKLVRQCLAHNRAAQRLLYERYDQHTFRVCFRYVRERQDAEDCQVKGFVKVFENIANFEFRGEGSLERWIKTIVINECLMFLRKKNRFQWEAESAAGHLAAPDTADGELAAEEIYKLIRLLPDGYRTVFNLFALEGYSHKEIAEKMGISVNTSKSQLSKARAVLQKMLIKNEIHHERSKTRQVYTKQAQNA